MITAATASNLTREARRSYREKDVLQNLETEIENSIAKRAGEGFYDYGIYLPEDLAQELKKTMEKAGFNAACSSIVHVETPKYKETKKRFYDEREVIVHLGINWRE